MTWRRAVLIIVLLLADVGWGGGTGCGKFRIPAPPKKANVVVPAVPHAGSVAAGR
jgi:hypothetical protein